MSEDRAADRRAGCRAGEAIGFRRSRRHFAFEPRRPARADRHATAMKAGPFLAVVVSLGLMAPACTAVYRNGGPPAVTVDTPFGPSPLNAGNQPPPGGSLATPPANLDGGLPAPATRSRNGT